MAQDYTQWKPELGGIDYPFSIDNLIDALHLDINDANTGIEKRLLDVTNDKANKVTTLLPAGNLAELESDGDIKDSTILATEVAKKASSIDPSNANFLVSIDVEGKLKSSGLSTVAAGLNDSVSSLTDTDLDTSPPTNGDMLEFNNGIWSNVPQQFDNSQITGLGTMALQNDNAVDINGGNLDLVIINNSTLQNSALTNCTINSLSSDLSVSNGGTGRGSVTSGALLYGNGTGALSAAGIGTSGKVLTSNGSIPYWADPVVSQGLGLSGESWHNRTVTVNNWFTNTRVYPIMVIINITLINDASADIYCAPTNPGNNKIGRVYSRADSGVDNDAVMPFSFICPPNYIYKVTPTGGSVSIHSTEELY